MSPISERATLADWAPLAGWAALHTPSGIYGEARTRSVDDGLLRVRFSADGIDFAGHHRLKIRPPTGLRAELSQRVAKRDEMPQNTGERGGSVYRRAPRRAGDGFSALHSLKRRVTYASRRRLAGKIANRPVATATDRKEEWRHASHKSIECGTAPATGSAFAWQTGVA